MKQGVKPLASISLDLDNQWSYMKTHGDPGWEKYPSYFDRFIPDFLDLLDNLNLKITFFIVGQDAGLEKNTEALSLITETGHEVGNHSFHHDPWLHKYSREEIKRDVLEAEEQIIKISGRKPSGFRGPGFSWSPDLLEVLAENNYLYDASTLPTYIGPLARAYYFWNSHLSREDKGQRDGLFGSFKEGFTPVKPFCWQCGLDAKLLEIPVTTIPGIKVPFHLSYLLYLSSFSVNLMTSYLRTALILCRLTETEPSFLLHPLDFLGGDQLPELDFFPGRKIEVKRKIQIFKQVIGIISGYFNLINMSAHAKAILDRPKIKIQVLEKQKKGKGTVPSLCKRSEIY